MGDMNLRKYIGRAAAMLTVWCFVLTAVAPVSSVRGEAYEIGVTLPPLADERVGAAYAFYDGKIIVMGGYMSGLATTVDTVLIYDIATGVTTNGSRMAYGAEAIAHAQLPDGRIYLFGGYNSSVGPMSVVQIYDPAADEWEVLATETPVPLSVATGCLGYDGLIYIFGGWSYPNATMIYDPVRDFWEFGADNSINFWGAAAVAVNEAAIYVIGGGDLDIGAPLADVTVYNPIDDSWTSVEPLPYATGFPGATLARNGYIYVIGGLPFSVFGGGSEFGRILRYEIVEDSWEESDEMLNWPRAFPGVVEDDYGRVFVVGGCNAGDATATVEMFLMSETSGYASLVITSPSNGSTVSGVVVVEATLVNSYFDPLMGIDFYVDGELQESQGIGTSWAFAWDTTGLLDASVHQLLLRGYYWDSSIKEASITVTVSTMSLDEKLDMLGDEVADLMADLDMLNTTVNAQSMDIETLQAAVDAVQMEIDELMAELSSLSDDVSDMDSAVRDEIDELENQISSLEATVAALQGALDGLQDSVDDVQTSVDSKADNALLYAALGLLVVVIILLAIMMVISKKPKVPTPEPPPEPPVD